MMTNIPYPAALGSCRINAKIAQALLDSTDSDQKPDLPPLAGEVIIFTPTVRRVRYNGETPLILVTPPLEARIGSDGVLRGSDNSPGVVLLATDDERLNPTGWAYEVSFKNKRLKIPSFKIPAPSGTVLDLASLTPVDDIQAKVFVPDESAALRAEAAASKAKRDAATAAAANARAEAAATQSARDAAIATNRASEATRAQQAAEQAQTSAQQTVSGFDQHAHQSHEAAQRELDTKLSQVTNELDNKISQASEYAQEAQREATRLTSSLQRYLGELQEEGQTQTTQIRTTGQEEINKLKNNGESLISQAQLSATQAANNAEEAAHSSADAALKATEATSAKNEVARMISEHGGIPGPAGPQGQPGRNGERGPAGSAGRDGHTPTIAMNGDQITVDGHIIGPHLTGPRGATGAAGTPGHNGSNGTPGKGIVNTRTGIEMKLWHGSQSEYDRISFKDSNTLYFITA